jgi:hypothetical protein
MHDRMFQVLVLGGMALVGCGGSTLTEANKGAGDAKPSDATSGDTAFPSETNAGLLDGSGDVTAEHTEAGSSVDAQASETGTGDADGYADATVGETGCRVPCEQ